MEQSIPTYSTATTDLSISEKMGQCFMAAAFINDSETSVRELEELISDGLVGGLCFFHSRASAATNFEGKQEIPVNMDSLGRLKELIQRYQAAAPYPLLMSMDAEWGLAMRVEATPVYPRAITLGAIKGGDALVRQVGHAIGKDCREAGIHWNFAPVADINSNPDNPVIGYRSFGSSPEAVLRLASAYAAGLNDAGCLNCIKHFPGHGDTSADSHLQLPQLDHPISLLRRRELYPFDQLIKEGVDSVMVGHLGVPALDNGKNRPATLSPTLIKKVLREDLGFQGVVVSDALNMRALPEGGPGSIELAAFRAGNDLLCFPRHTRAGHALILEELPPGRIEESFRRIWALKQSVFDGSTMPTNPVPPELLKQLAMASLTLYKGDDAYLEQMRKGDLKLVEIGSKDEIFRRTLERSIVLKNELHTPLLLALYPPAMKPGGNFGFSTEQLELVDQLMREREVVLYHFGNPYALDLLDLRNAKAVVIAYETIPEFQETAALHFLGNLPATGQLPVSLKNTCS